MAETKKNEVEHYPSRKHRSPRTVFDQGYVTVLGAEAPDDGALRALRVCAYDAGYTFLYRDSNWVAVRRDLILPGTYRFGASPRVTWVQCEIEDFGLVAFLATTPEYAEEYGLDELLDELGLEATLVFYGGTKHVDKYERVSSDPEVETSED